MTNQQQNAFTGAEGDLEHCVDTHLFVIGPNNCGSTFVSKALEQCAATWSLPREGQHMLGYVGPDTIAGGIPLTWAGSQKAIEHMVNPTEYDWQKTRKAWYFQARAARSDANILVARSPPFLLVTDQLVEHFPSAHFIFLLRNPYAIVEGICRRTGSGKSERAGALRTAIRHVVNCFEFQQRNIQRYRSSGVFLTYESICANPAAAQKAIQAKLPRLDDLNFNQKIAVKGIYDEVLRNMNDDQINRLSRDDIRTINETLSSHLDLLSAFGYELLSER